MAWTRTALSSAALGVVLMRAFGDRTGFLATGLLLVFQGLVFLIYAGYRYYRLMYLIEKKQFDPTKIAVALLTLLTVSVVTTVAVLIAISTN